MNPATDVAYRESKTATAGPDLTPKVEQPVTLRPTAPPAAPALDFMQIVQVALDKGYTPEQTERFIAMAEAREAKNARLAFDYAFTAFKAEAIRVQKSRTVNDGPLKGTRYATLNDFIEAATAALSRHGLAHSWRILQDTDLIEVEISLRHVDGHEKTVKLSAMPDIGPGRNKLQAKGSAISYCVRYGTEGLLGLKGSDEDEDDGAGADREINGQRPDPNPAPRKRSPEHQAIIDDWRTVIGATTTDADARKEWFACNTAVKHNKADYDEMYAFTAAHRNGLKAKAGAA